MTSRQVVNERSAFLDHVRYFRRQSGGLSELWDILARLSELPALADPRRPLQRIKEAHARHSRWLEVRWASIFLMLSSVWWLRQRLTGLGARMLTILDAGPFAQTLPILLSPARVLAWVVQRLSPEASLSEQTAEELIVGLLAPLVFIWLWSLGFKAVWQARWGTHWDAARRDGEQPGSGKWRVRLGWALHLALWTLLACGPMALLGAAAVARGWIDGAVMGRALNCGLALLCLLGSIRLVLSTLDLLSAGIATINKVKFSGDQARDAQMYRVVRHTWASFVLALPELALASALWAWPYALPQLKLATYGVRSVSEVLYCGLYMLFAIGWQLFWLRRIPMATGHSKAFVLLGPIGVVCTTALVCLYAPVPWKVTFLWASFVVLPLPRLTSRWCVLLVLVGPTSLAGALWLWLREVHARPDPPELVTIYNLVYPMAMTNFLLLITDVAIIARALVRGAKEKPEGTQLVEP